VNVVIDTNILMSALIKPDGVIFDLIRLLHHQQHLLYISDYSLVELSNHHNRILKASALDIHDFDKNKIFLLKKIIIISSDFISDTDLTEATTLTSGIDKYDIVFVATALFVKGHLWTGDKPLYNGLKEKDFNNVLNSNDIKQLINYE
jgi:predicted nucleic acid-binding protein